MSDSCPSGRVPEIRGGGGGQRCDRTFAWFWLLRLTSPFYRSSQTTNTVTLSLLFTSGWAAGSKPLPAQVIPKEQTQMETYEQNWKDLIKNLDLFVHKNQKSVNPNLQWVFFLQFISILPHLDTIAWNTEALRTLHTAKAGKTNNKQSSSICSQAQDNHIPC